MQAKSVPHGTLTHLATWRAFAQANASPSAARHDASATGRGVVVGSEVVKTPLASLGALGARGSSESAAES